MNELTPERSRTNASIALNALANWDNARDTNELTLESKHCKKRFSRLLICKEHEGRHVRGTYFGREQHEQRFQVKRHHLESSSTLGVKKCGLLFSSLTAEENSRHVESLTCWICQKEFSSEACLIQHYDDHIRINQTVS